MKRAANDDKQNTRVPVVPENGKLITKISGSNIKIRRVDQATANKYHATTLVCPKLPPEFYKRIFEFLLETLPNQQKSSNLLELTKVCQFFNIIINSIFEENLTTSPMAEGVMLFERSFLNANKWIISAINFEQRSNASIRVLNEFAQNFCLSDQVLKLYSHDRETLFNFLIEYNPKENLSKLFAKQVLLLCEFLLDWRAILSADFLIYLLKRELVDLKCIPSISDRVFTILQHSKTPPRERSYMLRVLQQLLKMNSVQLSDIAVRFLRTYAFAEFAAPIDPMLPVQRKDAAMGIMQELIAAGYILDLKSSEMKILKDHAIKRLAFVHADLDFKQDILELLCYIIEIEELFSLVSLSFFEQIHSCFIIKNFHYSPSETQRLINIYDLFSKHPGKEIRFLAIAISIFIKDGASALKKHVSILLQDPTCTWISKNCHLASLAALLKSNSIKLEEPEVQMLKDDVFSHLCRIITPPSVIKQQNAAVHILQDLVASGTSIVLTKDELEVLKYYVEGEFKNDSVDLLSKQNLLELLLHFVSNTTELFPIVSLKFFERVKNFILYNKQTYISSVAQKLAKIYDQFLDHPDQQIAFLAAEISLLIAGILPDGM